MFAGSLNALVLARVITGLCAAAIIPLSMAWIGDAVPYEQRQETLAKVGLGTTLGAGCTSGHGICGIARLSMRSIVSTAVFMFFAVATVYLMRHVIGAS